MDKHECDEEHMNTHECIECGSGDNSLHFGDSEFDWGQVLIAFRAEEYDCGHEWEIPSGWWLRVTT